MMNCKQTTPRTESAPKAFSPWCASCALKQEDRIIGGFETLPAIDKRIELCFLEKQLAALQREYEEKAGIYLAEDDGDTLMSGGDSAGDSDIQVAELAERIRQEGVSIGRNQLYTWLRKKGYAYFNERVNRNLPTSQSLNLRLMTVKYRTYVEKKSGRLKQSPELRITPLGQVFFIRAVAEERSRG